MKTNENS